MTTSNTGRTGAPNFKKLLTLMLVGASMGISVSCSEGRGARGTIAQTTPVAQEFLDFEFYRENVEPLFLRPRGGFAAPDAPCVSCHTYQATTPLKLEVPVEEEGRVYWTEEQSRKNFSIVSRLVNLSDVESSRLLMAPLSPAAGGRRHTGGGIWESQDDPEWKVIVEWINAASPNPGPQEPEVALDFEFFRACVQPMFVNARENMANCTSCHSGEFALLPQDGRGNWTEEESRAAFNVLSNFVEPGYPEYSRFLHKPLHPRGGGDLMHNGPRRWADRNDPEWQALAEWVRGVARGSTCPAALQY